MAPVSGRARSTEEGGRDGPDGEGDLGGRAQVADLAPRDGAGGRGDAVGHRRGDGEAQRAADADRCARSRARLGRAAREGGAVVSETKWTPGPWAPEYDEYGDE